ncbi:MAG: GNAT family N-acetyltransferase [Clostridiales bacterium]|nr:GNAT family N-acetyltransferase [Clostridiales bacterium]
MSVSIKNTNPSEVEELSQIQKAAFKHLYEKHRDDSNPFLRGPEDILRRLNKFNRHYTILYDGKTVGGIYYRLYGRRIPDYEIGAGEYYLARIFIHPDYQNKKIARNAILLCEKEFPDARLYYLDLPEDMEKNRRCYQSVGYRDTGERIRINDALTLATFKKTVNDAFDPAGVTLPMIYKADREELNECLEVIHQSFSTVAEQFGLTKENCPKHTSFLPLSAIEAQIDRGWRMFALYAGKKIIGYISLSEESDDTFELHNFAVLPEYRHNGFGKLLLDHAKDTVKSLGGSVIKIGIIEESTVLKNWYIANGFVHTGVKKYDHLPFTSGYMEWRV